MFVRHDSPYNIYVQPNLDPNLYKTQVEGADVPFTGVLALPTFPYTERMGMT